MDVQLEHLYILAGQKRRGKGDHGWIVAADDFEHGEDVGIPPLNVETKKECA